MKNNNSRVTTGVLVVLAGVLFLLSNLGVPALGDLFNTWWPSLVALLGLVILINNLRAWVFPLLLIGFGTLMQLNNLEVINVNIWQILWPVIVIAVGVSIIADRYKGKTMVGDSRHSITALLGGTEEKNNSQDYQGGKISAVFGGTSLDLRKAVIKKDAIIEVFAVCGGAEIFVPEGVVVHKKLTHILGGTEDKTAAPAAKDAPVLHIVGTIVMGGIELKN